jgi:hypothetical protein
LWQEGDSDTVVLQYSVAADWKAKILKTAEAVTKRPAGPTVLIYVTSHVIGAQGEVVRKRLLRDYKLFLDIRDQSWFLDGLHLHPAREHAAEDLAVALVDPLLASKGIMEGKGQALTTAEMHAAFVHLALQWEDDSRDKGLTKTTYDALVRMVLRYTDSEHRRTRADIHSAIASVLPNHDRKHVEEFTDSSLRRLTKLYIRHWTKQDEFCLTHVEATRLRERLTTLEVRGRELDDELQVTISSVATAVGCQLGRLRLGTMVTTVRRTLEEILLARGEAFVAAVSHGDAGRLEGSDIRSFVLRDISRRPGKRARPDDIAVTFGAIEKILNTPGVRTREYLQSLSDAYTLCAFLRETPDIQSAVSKIFSHGEIWLDSTVILPLFTEELVAPEARKLQTILRASRQAGLKLYMTTGILEEVEAHLFIGLRYARHDETREPWRSRRPFIFEEYALAGEAPEGFASWVETFRGDANPKDDVADYLREEFGITIRELESEASAAPTRLRAVVQEVWRPVHERRRREAGDRDPNLTHALIAHDVETYVGVIQRRRERHRGALGHTSWLLTLDRTALEVHGRLKEEFGRRCPDSPVLSPDFMLSYLSVGPGRSRTEPGGSPALPLTADMGHLEVVPQEVLDLAGTLRGELEDLSPRVVRRRVRDALDAARWRLGDLEVAGMPASWTPESDVIRHAGKAIRRRPP